MNALENTWRLIRLALRRDRIKLPIWVVAIVGLVAASVPTLASVYDTPEQQAQYAIGITNSAIGRAFGGVMNGPTLGDITMVEMFAFTSVLIAFMSTTLVVRHTRYNEESGASELIGSGVVGRKSSLSAALIVAFGVNILVGGLISAFFLSMGDYSASGSLGFGAAMAIIGCFFAAVAAVTSQLSQSSRGANGMATSAIGAAFLLRAIGDGFASVNTTALSSTAAWPSFISPIGVGYQSFPFSSQRWYLLAILIASILAISYLAYALLLKRDVGSGLLPDKPGPARAKSSLLSTLGLSWKLQKGVFIGWFVFFVIFGVIFGGMAKDFEGVLANIEGANELLALYGEGQSIIDLFFGIMLVMAGTLAGGYGVQALLKMRTEESTGRIESILGAAVKRHRWMLSHILITVAGSMALVATIGFFGGLMYFISGGDADTVWKLTRASILQIPAVLAFIGLTVFTFGALPRFTAGIAWGSFIGVLTISQLGAILKLPQWVVDISPFTHAPTNINGSIDLQPLIIMTTAGVALITTGILLFKNRDVALS